MLEATFFGVMLLGRARVPGWFEGDGTNDGRREPGRRKLVSAHAARGHSRRAYGTRGSDLPPLPRAGGPPSRRDDEAVGFLLVIAACAAATALAAWLVRRFSPHASGSGIPHVEAVLRGKLPPASFLLIPVKFTGGHWRGPGAWAREPSRWGRASPISSAGYFVEAGRTAAC